MAAPPAAVRRELGAAPPRPRAPGQRWRGWRCGGSGRPWRPAALASRCGRPRRGAWPPARWRCPVSGERELAVEAAGLSERLRGVLGRPAAPCPVPRGCGAGAPPVWGCPGGPGAGGTCRGLLARCTCLRRGLRAGGAVCPGHGVGHTW